MNRGIARRTLFEGRADVRFFLSRLARSIRRGELEVHAYCVMTTHFHLLVRSLEGCLSEAMRRIQNDYVRHFNRTRRRDGPLVRGRFRSKPVASLAYRRTLVRYIDANPVRAGLSGRAEDYPYGSARAYSRPTGPPWLERSWVESCVVADLGLDRYDPTAYPRSFGSGCSAAQWRLVERRITLAGAHEDPLDDLLAAADGRTAEWMKRKSRLADGTRPGVPLSDPDDVDEVWTRERLERGAWSIRGARGRWDGWHIARVGILRDLCGDTFREIAGRTGRSRQDAYQNHARHLDLLGSDPDYAHRVAELTQRALARTWETTDSTRVGSPPTLAAENSRRTAAPPCLGG